MEAMPESLRNPARHESAEGSMPSMEDALDKLAEIYWYHANRFGSTWKQGLCALLDKGMA